MRSRPRNEPLFIAGMGLLCISIAWSCNDSLGIAFAGVGLVVMLVAW